MTAVTDTPPKAPPRRSPLRRVARNAGGRRWAVWAGRAVLWAVLLVLLVNGVEAIVARGHHPPPAKPKPPPPAAQFPVGMAQAFAYEFGGVYFNTGPQRQQLLAAYLPAGTSDPALGLAGGTMTLQAEQVAGTTVTDAHHALVRLLAQVNGHTGLWSVPVYYADGAMAVTGQPALLPAPAQAQIPPPPAQPSDEAAQQAIQTLLPSFFAAYASGDQATLQRFLAPGATLPGLGQQVTYQSLQALTVPPGGAVRHAVATVRWQMGGAVLDTTYDLTMAQAGGNWYVQAMSGSTAPQAAGGSS